MDKVVPHQQLTYFANQTRKLILQMGNSAHSGHTAGPLGMADVFALLYLEILHHRPNEPELADRDRLFLSNGHICPVLYATLAQIGYFSVSELMTFRQIDSRLQGHPHLGSVPGVENSSGPLGQGLSQAVGCALAFQMDQQAQRVYVVSSDGEQQEGQTWEAYMFAGDHHLSNLTFIIDYNQIQISGFTKDVLSIEPFLQKLVDFKLHPFLVNGHDFAELRQAFNLAHQVTDQPSVIVCQTIPGKGVSFMENKPEWHGKPASDEELTAALAELEQEDE